MEAVTGRGGAVRGAVGGDAATLHGVRRKPAAGPRTGREAIRLVPTRPPWGVAAWGVAAGREGEGPQLWDARTLGMCLRSLLVASSKLKCGGTYGRPALTLIQPPSLRYSPASSPSSSPKVATGVSASCGV